MQYVALKQFIIYLDMDLKKIIYDSDDSTQIFIYKPLKVPKKLKQSKRYDPKLNFQIGISRKGEKEFLPNHLRMLIDLYLKREENQKESEVLFDAIEDVYKGEDPLKFQKKLTELKFKRQLETSFTDLCLIQLFMLEQDINYRFGKVQPPRSYLMGYIRIVRQNAMELDKLLWASVRHAPKTEYRKD